MTSAADGGYVKARLCLAVTCGLPGAGKTTLCKALLGISHANVMVRHISFDDFLQTKLPEKENNDVTAFQASTPAPSSKLNGLTGSPIGSWKRAIT